MGDRKNIVFLYTRLAEYFYQCIVSMVKENEDIDVIIVRYSHDENAPFSYHNSDRITIFPKDSFLSCLELKEFLKTKSPSLIYTAGWSDREYRSVAKYFSGSVPTVLGLDNPWLGTVRQRLGVLFYSYYMNRIYSHVWVAGRSQFEFAKRMRFKNSNILACLYSANTEEFSRLSVFRNSPEITVPKKLLFVGRYLEYKQPLLLVKVFSEILSENQANGWTLELIGAGPLKDELLKYSAKSIVIGDFINPESLPTKFSSAGAFCLPSRNEHWGVVVHEAAASGLPLVLSDKVFSASNFLINEYNGYKFTCEDKADLKRCLLKLFSLSNAELLQKGERSYKLSAKLGKEDWAANLLSIFE